MQKRAWVLSLVLALGPYSVAGEETPDRALTADEVLESETVIEGLRGNLAKLSKSVMNLSFPDAQSLATLEPRLDVVDLGARPGKPAKEDENILGLGLDRWQMAGLRPTNGCGSDGPDALGQLLGNRGFLSSLQLLQRPRPLRGCRQIAI